MEILSPDVKEFLRKNRIRVRKENNNQEFHKSTPSERGNSKPKHLDFPKKQMSIPDNQP
jgi:hypothetical protein